MSKFTISMAMFNSYFDITKGFFSGVSADAQLRPPASPLHPRKSDSGTMWVSGWLPAQSRKPGFQMRAELPVKPGMGTMGMMGMDGYQIG